MKKYQIIYADPPWNVSQFSRIVRPSQKPHPYPKMSLEDIKKLPVKNIADPNGCHLFLWTTHKWLPKSFEVIEAWGFKYHCVITWDKTFGFTPFSFMWSTEFCLYGQLKKKWIRPNKFGIKTIFSEKPTKHSRKPKIMRFIIEEYCGKLPRIELFAREKTPGWDVWGNEVESDINLCSPTQDKS
jgi:N6-adenosine-specific RNA methylase IME4